MACDMLAIASLASGLQLLVWVGTSDISLFVEGGWLRESGTICPSNLMPVNVMWRVVVLLDFPLFYKQFRLFLGLGTPNSLFPKGPCGTKSTMGSNHYLDSNSLPQ